MILELSKEMHAMLPVFDHANFLPNIVSDEANSLRTEVD